MEKPCTVGMRKTLGQAQCQFTHLTFGECASASQFLLESFSLDQFHGEPAIPSRDSRIECMNDVRVIEQGSIACL